MKSERRWIRTLALAAIIAGPLAGFLIVWFQLTREEQSLLEQLLNEHPSAILSTLFLLFAVLAGGVLWVFRHYIEPARRMAEETRVITTTNASHRITGIEHGDMGLLARVINESADRFESLTTNVAEQIRQSNQNLEREKNALATLIQELTGGILVCTLEGQILLYNRQASRLLSREATGGLVGLGRSIFACIERALVTHALDELTLQEERGTGPAASHFVTTGAASQLLRVQVVPLLEHSHRMSGFILVLEDITQRVEHDNRRDYLLQSLTEGLRSSMAAIRTAVESLDQTPGERTQEHRRLAGIIREESLSLSTRIDKAVTDSASYFRSQWPLEDILCTDLLAALKRRAEQTLDVNVAIVTPSQQLWAKVDSYSLLEAFLFFVNEVKRGMGVIEFTFRGMPHDNFADLRLEWKGPPFPAGRLRAWEAQSLIFEGHGVPSTLGDVLKRHGASLQSQEEPDHRSSSLQILLPTISPAAARAPLGTMDVKSRPEFYDFDLFERTGRDSNLEQQLLTDIVYTAFDTETTGLSPAQGDEIISIGAIRIVNSKLLRKETFDQLVNPLRHLTRESMKIHGIQPDMLKDQPTLATVLPAFQRFSDGTILVAHNAAFDLRFFQLKEAMTGVKFINPVLDTLLLSSVVHPNQEGHNLEEIAMRLGVDVIGRHTALGDAIVTAEVFVKLLPLLMTQGIRTLRDALEASKRSYYARVRY